MTRIIAGAAGSLSLAVPESGTRPTSDRVRESLFASLESAGLVDGSAVLDLYAGSGALGLEAISRGAAQADLVERAPKAAAVAERNARRVAASVAATGPGPRVRVHRAAADAFLRQDGPSYDLVFLDPPYELGEEELSGTLTLLRPRLAPSATVVVERAARSPQPVPPAGLGVDRSKRFGDTTLWWLSAS